MGVQCSAGCNAPLTKASKTVPCNKRWRYVQYIAAQFWSRIKKRVPSLQIRSKWLPAKLILKLVI